MATAARLALIVTAAWSAGACDPCDGTVACTDEHVYAVVGSIVRPPNGRPAGGVRVSVGFEVNGVEIGRRVATTVGDGSWELKIPATDTLPATARAWVYRTSTDSFAIPPFVVRPSTTRGQAKVAEPWMNEPFAWQQRSILYNGAPMAGALVRYFPNGGVARPDDPGWQGYTNGAGVFEVPVRGTAVGVVYGTLIITYERVGLTWVVEHYPLESGYRWEIPRVRGTLFFP